MSKALSLIDLKPNMGNPIAAAVASLLWAASPLMQQIRFIPHSDLTYGWFQEGSLPEVGARGLNEDFADQLEGKDNRKFTGLAILGGKIKTDSIHIEQKGQAARTRRIAQKSKAMARMFDRLFFNGAAANNAKKEFNGLKTKLTGSQLLTNATDGAVPDYKKVVELQDSVYGPNSEKVLFMNRTVRRLLSEDVGDSAGGRNVMDVGRQLKMFEGSTIIEVDKDETETEILRFNETCGASNVCSSIYCVRFGTGVSEDGVQAISGLRQTISAKGPIDFGSYVADWVHLVAAIEVFGKYDAARLQGVKAS